ncbi:MAG: hypothetical protein JW989_08130 [Chlorobiaceae bacterium]|nr:hypothetical protein [Chlorobiaceae bacterium]
MTGNSSALPGASPRGQNQNREDRANDRAQKKDTIPSDNLKAFDLDAYRRNVRRACSDAYVLLKDFPSKLRFSYYVDRNGCIRCTKEQGGQR